MRMYYRYRSNGFTIIEILITVALIGILSAIALPNYNEYVLKGKLAEAYANLATLQTRMEQYYQDNRRYGNSAATLAACPTAADAAAQTNCGIPCPAAPNVKYFTFSCTLGAGATGDQTYTYSAASSQLGFTFTVTDTGAKRTTAVGTGWSGSGNNCWVRSKDGSC
jgi:type IV pilus assembly protein PilE